MVNDVAVARRGTARELWLAGWKQTDIARYLGISRQRVSQLVADFAIGREWATWWELGFRRGLLNKWVERGWVRKSYGSLYSVEDVKATEQRLLTRICEYPECEARTWSLDARVRFCSVHSKEAQRYRWPVSSPEARVKMKAATRRWQEKNPERWRQISRRATTTYFLINHKGMSREEARKLAREKYP